MNDAEYEALVKVTQHTEWVMEPMDEFEDIIDPCHYDSEKLARADVASLFVQFPEAVRIEMARRTRKGSEAEGMTDQKYDYRAAWVRTPDGYAEAPLSIKSR